MQSADTTNKDATPATDFIQRENLSRLQTADGESQKTIRQNESDNTDRTQTASTITSTVAINSKTSPNITPQYRLPSFEEILGISSIFRPRDNDGNLGAYSSFVLPGAVGNASSTSSQGRVQPVQNQEVGYKTNHEENLRHPTTTASTGQPNFLTTSHSTQQTMANQPGKISAEIPKVTGPNNQHLHEYGQQGHQAVQALNAHNFLQVNQGNTSLTSCAPTVQWHSTTCSNNTQNRAQNALKKLSEHKKENLPVHPSDKMPVSPYSIQTVELHKCDDPPDHTCSIQTMATVQPADKDTPARTCSPQILATVQSKRKDTTLHTCTCHPQTLATLQLADKDIPPHTCSPQSLVTVQSAYKDIPVNQDKKVATIAKKLAPSESTTSAQITVKETVTSSNYDSLEKKFVKIAPKPAKSSSPLSEIVPESRSKLVFTRMCEDSTNRTATQGQLGSTLSSSTSQHETTTGQTEPTQCIILQPIPGLPLPNTIQTSSINSDIKYATLLPLNFPWNQNATSAGASSVNAPFVTFCNLQVKSVANVPPPVTNQCNGKPTNVVAVESSQSVDHQENVTSAMCSKQSCDGKELQKTPLENVNFKQLTSETVNSGLRTTGEISSMKPARQVKKDTETSTHNSKIKIIKDGQKQVDVAQETEQNQKHSQSDRGVIKSEGQSMRTEITPNTLQPLVCSTEVDLHQLPQTTKSVPAINLTHTAQHTPGFKGSTADLNYYRESPWNPIWRFQNDIDTNFGKIACKPSAQDQCTSIQQKTSHEPTFPSLSPASDSRFDHANRISMLHSPSSTDSYDKFWSDLQAIMAPDMDKKNLRSISSPDGSDKENTDPPKSHTHTQVISDKDQQTQYQQQLWEHHHRANTTNYNRTYAAWPAIKKSNPDKQDCPQQASSYHKMNTTVGLELRPQQSYPAEQGLKLQQSCQPQGSAFTSLHKGSSVEGFNQLQPQPFQNFQSGSSFSAMQASKYGDLTSRINNLLFQIEMFKHSFPSKAEYLLNYFQCQQSLIESERRYALGDNIIQPMFHQSMVNSHYDAQLLKIVEYVEASIQSIWTSSFTENLLPPDSCENYPKSSSNPIWTKNQAQHNPQNFKNMPQFDANWNKVGTEPTEVTSTHSSLPPAEYQPGTGLPYTRRGRSQLSRRSVAMMEEWYHQNVDHPYPNAITVEVLAKSGGICPEQVKKWFANKRNRSKNTRTLEEIASRKRKLAQATDISQAEAKRPRM